MSRETPICGGIINDKALVMHDGIVAEGKRTGSLRQARLGPILDPSMILLEEDHQHNRDLEKILRDRTDPVQAGRKPAIENIETAEGF
nr:hypothetical protein [Microvirga roseola]